MIDPHTLEPATTIEQVVERIESIIDESLQAGDRVGFFAALYQHVATTFEEAVAQKQFEHPGLISKLDIVFFNRYLTALEQFRRGERCSACWQVAFDAAADNRPIVVQHLAMGMNAHICFDLAIAVADSVPREKLAAFRPDFDRMNELLASLLDDIQDDLAHIWPWLKPLDRLFGNTEEMLVNLSMRQVRQLAWQHAQRLAESEPEGRRELEASTDSYVTLLQRVLHRPPIPLSWGLWLVRVGEKGDVTEQIRALRYTHAVEKQKQKLRASAPVARSAQDEDGRPGAPIQQEKAQARPRA